MIPVTDPGRADYEGEEMREKIARVGFNAWYGRPEYDEHPVQGMWERVADAIISGPLAQLQADLIAVRKERDAFEQEVKGLRERLLGASASQIEPSQVEPLRVSPASAASVSRAWRRDPETTIIEYRQAYEDANRHSLGCRINYARGWYEFRSAHSSYVFDRKRYAQLVEMTARLRARANDERAQRENAKRSSPKDASVIGKAEAPNPTPQPHSHTEEAGNV